MRGKVPKVAVTMGDPAGVGPEILAKALMRPDVYDISETVVYGSAKALVDAFSLIGEKASWDGESITFRGKRVKVVLPSGNDLAEVIPGKLTEEGSRLMMGAVERAVRDAVDGKVAAVVTCPITKEGIALAGLPYPGHTEYIRDLTGTGKVVMMLAGEKLRVALVTIHVSLRRALELVTRERVEETIRIVHRDFVEKLGIERPRIVVAGLNPHAGEGGLFGSEEEEMIRPAVEAVRRDGIEAKGPYPPDTVFLRAYRGEFDVVVAQYHDQGLIPLKLVHFETGVNVTLGLPIVRTSVDHGTAYDIAWKGIAMETSLVSAVKLAVQMGERRWDEQG